MGSLTNKNPPIAVGKVMIYSTYLGTNTNGDIIVDVCTRFSYPNLYNDQRNTSSHLCSPSQQIDVSAASDDTSITCCDLYKVSSQDLEFHMQIVLKNYDPRSSLIDCDGSKLAYTMNVETNSSYIVDTRDEACTSNGKSGEQQPYLFASCEDDNNDETVDTFGTVKSTTCDSDPLEFPSRISPNLIVNDDSDDREIFEDKSTMISLEDDKIAKNEIDAIATAIHKSGEEATSFSRMELETEELKSLTVYPFVRPMTTAKEGPEPHSSDLEVSQPLKRKVRRGQPAKSSKIFVPPTLSATNDGKICSIEGLRVERSRKYDNNKRFREKKTRCVFCNDDVDHFARHLLRKHKREKDVLAFSFLPKEDKMRALLIGCLRKRGNFTKITDNIISPVRRPREGKHHELFYQACHFCQGLYNAKYLRRHYKRCPFYSTEETEPAVSKKKNDYTIKNS